MKNTIKLEEFTTSYNDNYGSPRIEVERFCIITNEEETELNEYKIRYYFNPVNGKPLVLSVIPYEGERLERKEEHRLQDEIGEYLKNNK